MYKIQLPTFEKLQIELMELAPSEAEAICTMIQNTLGLLTDIDGLAEVVEVLAPLFSADPWSGYDFPKESRQHVDGLIRLFELQKRFPQLISRTYASSRLNHSVSKRPLMTTWLAKGHPFTPAQFEVARFLQATLFVWRSQNPGEVPAAILKLCTGIRSLLQKSNQTSWSECKSPREWLAEIIFQAADKEHALHDILKGLRALHSSLEGTQSKTPSPRWGIFQNSLPPRLSGSTSIQFSTRSPKTPRSFPIYIPPADGPDGEPIVEVWLRDDDGDAAGLGRNDQYARLREARYRTARENNFLPWDWHVLNHAELRTLIPLLLAEQREEFQTAITLCLITIACCIDFRELLDTRFVTEWDDLPGLQIVIASGEWGRKFPQLPGRFTPSSEQASTLLPHQELLTLPLPQALAIRLQSTEISKATVAKQFRLTKPEDVEACMQRWLIEQRQRQPSIRATPARLRRIIFDEGIRSHGDELIASLTINSAQFAPNVGFYYYSAPTSRLAEYYCQNLLSIGLPAGKSILSEGRLGSHLFLAPAHHASHLRTRMHEFSTSAPLAMQVEYVELVHRHRQMACYTAWFLQCATGHRAAEQYSFAMPTLDPTGWVILRDKVIDEAHRARLVRLSPLAQQQIEAYCIHLRGLAQRLSKYNEQLAKQIGRMGDLPGLHDSVRYWLFLLPDTPSQTLLKLGSAEVQSWLQLQPSLPGNLPRHWFISALRERGLFGEWVSGAAGHIQAGQQPWSVSMVGAPSAIADKWDRVVDGWLSELGFAVYPGIEVINKKTIPHSSCLLSLNAKPPVRATELAQQHNIKTAKALLKEKFSKHTLQELLNSDVLQHDVFNAISQSNDFSERQKKQTINALTLFIRRKKGLPSGGFVLDSPTEAAPIDYDHLLCVRRGDWLRNRLTKCFPDKPSDLSLPELLAWAHLCLIIESGVNYPYPALRAIPNGGLRHFKGEIWLEWLDNQRLVRCWPGPLSALVLLALQARPIQAWPASRKGDKATVAGDVIWPQAEFTIALNRIVDQVFALAEYWPADPILRKASYIANIMQAWQQQHWPGLLASYARSEIKAWAIPQENLLRLLGKQRSTLARSPELDECITPLPDTSPLPADHIKTRQALKQLRESIQEYQQGTGSGFHSAKGVISNIKKQELLWKSQSVGQILHLLAHYACHKLAIKIKDGSHYSESTITHYVFGVGEPLVTLCWADNLLDYDSENFEDIYKQALNYNEKPEGKKWRGKYIRYFHEFLVDQYDVPEVDFAQLDPAFEGVASRVHAQILRHQEYMDAKQLLGEDPHATTEERILQELALILVFRFGLRIAECLRLRRCDLVFQDDLIIVYVRESKHGSPKSRAGFRQLPCWTFSTEERQLLEHRFTVLEARFGAENQTPLFSATDTHEEMIPLARLRQRMLQALKLATGNIECRIHHARHTFASVITLLATTKHIPFFEELAQWFPEGIQKIQDVWLGTTHPTRRLMHALSCHMGHAQLSTTLSSYTHSLDLCLAAQIRQSPLEHPIIRKLAGWSGLSEEACKLRRHREKNDAIFLSGLIQAAIKKSRLPEVTAILDQEPLTPLSPRRVDDRPSLRLLHKAITELKSGSSPAQIAACFGYSSEQVVNIQNHYVALEQQTRYTGFDNPKTDRYLDNDFYLNLANRVTNYLDNHSELQEDLFKIWLSNYHPDIAGLALAVEQEQLVWKKFLLAIGAVDVWYSIREQHSNFINKETALIRHDRYRSQYLGRRGTVVAPVLLGQFHITQSATPSGRVLSQRELHHILVLNIIQYRLRKIEEKQLL